MRRLDNRPSRFQDGPIEIFLATQWLRIQCLVYKTTLYHVNSLGEIFSGLSGKISNYPNVSIRSLISITPSILSHCRKLES